MFGHRENALLREALTLYLGKHVLDQVLREGRGFLVPHGHTAELTMLFFDIGSFTAQGPSLDPTELGNWAVAYSDAMTETVGKHAGIFDVFVGDSGSAWWGADGAPHHADQAMVCARALLSAIGQLNTRYDPAKYPAIRLKIGIHTGLVSLGNFGSSTRLRYTVMGDAVNFASRLCGICSTYDVSVVLSHAVYTRAGDTSSVLYLDSVSVKGIDEPVRIYALEF